MGAQPKHTGTDFRQALYGRDSKMPYQAVVLQRLEQRLSHQAGQRRHIAALQHSHRFLPLSTRTKSASGKGRAA